VTKRDAQSPQTTSARFSRRSMSARSLAVGLAVPAAGAVAVTGAAAQATPTASDRQAINPGDLFSSAIVANGFVFTSGALGIDPETGELAGDDITAQTEQVLANLEATLTAAGSSLDRVVKSTCFLASLDDFEAFNDVYTTAFPSEPPARSTVEVSALALGALVEIDLVAVI
jgi:2-iminobutanoate/2-iminopropanoate deaminase